MIAFQLFLKEFVSENTFFKVPFYPWPNKDKWSTSNVLVYDMRKVDESNLYLSGMKNLCVQRN